MTLTLTVPPRADADRLNGLPVAIIGAGPVGLAAAAHLLERGLPVVVYEAGTAVGTSVRAWGHTRLFSPWQYVIDPAAQRRLIELATEPAAAAKPATDREDDLTAREVEVLTLIARGLSNAEIAAQLYLSVNTVKTHQRMIYRKLDAAGRRDAVSRAKQLGLL